MPLATATASPLDEPPAERVQLAVALIDAANMQLDQLDCRQFARTQHPDELGRRPQQDIGRCGHAHTLSPPARENDGPPTM
jgi:hypothetical protein